MRPPTFNRGFNPIKAEKDGIAHVWWGFALPSTPAPSPPVSLRDSWYWERGLASRSAKQSVTWAREKLRLKTKTKNNSVENPPTCPGGQVLDVGFSTPFPVGRPRCRGHFLTGGAV